MTGSLANRTVARLSAKALPVPRVHSTGVGASPSCPAKGKYELDPAHFGHAFPGKHVADNGMLGTLRKPEDF